MKITVEIPEGKYCNGCPFMAYESEVDAENCLYLPKLKLDNKRVWLDRDSKECGYQHTVKDKDCPGKKG